MERCFELQDLQSSARETHSAIDGAVAPCPPISMTFFRTNSILSNQRGSIRQ